MEGWRVGLGSLCKRGSVHVSRASARMVVVSVQCHRDADRMHVYVSYWCRAALSRCVEPVPNRHASYVYVRFTSYIGTLCHIAAPPNAIFGAFTS